MRIVGVMSGTSFDGIEVAAADFRPEGDVVEMAPMGELSVTYDEDLRRRIAAVLPPNGTTIEQVCQLDTLLGQAFGKAAARLGPADLVVSHGQTVFHWVESGRAKGTLQLGAAAWVAAMAGAPVLSDLRTADIAAGGQGAPLVPMFDALLLGGDRGAMLNLGGIANITVVVPGRPVVGYDIGPANALIDAAAWHYYREPFDEDGRHAASGGVDGELLDVLLGEPYYALQPPKSTGKELFNAEYVVQRAGGREPDDVIATLTELTARIVADACVKHRTGDVIASGGGIKNPVLMKRINELGIATTTSAGIGIPPQAKEAYAFALLGWLAWHGLPGALPSVTGAAEGALLGSWTPGPNGLRMPPPAGGSPRAVRVVRERGGPGLDRLGDHER